MYLNNWFGRLLIEKLGNKCSHEEIEELIKSIIERQDQRNIISFITKKECSVLLYEIEDIYAIEELKRGTSFSFIVKGKKYEDCFLANKKLDVFSLIHEYSDEFTLVDSRTLVRLTKVQAYNSDNGQLYFDIPEEGKSALWMQVNMNSLPLIKREIGTEKDTASPNSSFYTFRGGWRLKKNST